MKNLFTSKKKVKKSMSSSAVSGLSTNRKASLPVSETGGVGHIHQSSTGARLSVSPNNSSHAGLSDNPPQSRSSSATGSNPGSEKKNSGIFKYNYENYEPAGMYIGSGQRSRASASVSGVSDHDSSRAVMSESEDLNISSESLIQAWREMHDEDGGQRGMHTSYTTSSLLRNSTIKQAYRPRSIPLSDRHPEELFEYPDGLLSAKLGIFRPSLGLARGTPSQFMIQNDLTLTPTIQETHGAITYQPSDLCLSSEGLNLPSAKSPKTKAPHISVTKQIKNSAHAMEEVLRIVEQHIPEIKEKVCSAAESMNAVTVQDPENEANVPDTLLSIQQSAQSFRHLVANESLHQSLEGANRTIAKAHQFVTMFHDAFIMGVLAVVLILILLIVLLMNFVVTNIANSEHRTLMLIICTPLLVIYVMFVYAFIAFIRKLWTDMMSSH